MSALSEWFDRNINTPLTKARDMLPEGNAVRKLLEALPNATAAEAGAVAITNDMGFALSAEQQKQKLEEEAKAIAAEARERSDKIRALEIPLKREVRMAPSDTGMSEYYQEDYDRFVKEFERAKPKANGLSVTSVDELIAKRFSGDAEQMEAAKADLDKMKAVLDVENRAAAKEKLQPLETKIAESASKIDAFHKDTTVGRVQDTFSEVVAFATTGESKSSQTKALSDEQLAERLAEIDKMKIPDAMPTTMDGQARFDAFKENVEAARRYKESLAPAKTGPGTMLAADATAEGLIHLKTGLNDKEFELRRGGPGNTLEEYNKKEAEKKALAGQIDENFGKAKGQLEIVKNLLRMQAREANGKAWNTATERQTHIVQNAEAMADTAVNKGISAAKEVLSMALSNPITGSMKDLIDSQLKGVPLTSLGSMTDVATHGAPASGGGKAKSNGGPAV